MRILIMEKYEQRQLRELPEAYKEAMLELRGRKNLTLCWATRTTNNHGASVGIERLWSDGKPGQALPLVWCPTPHGVLQDHQGRAQGLRAFHKD